VGVQRLHRDKAAELLLVCLCVVRGMGRVEGVREGGREEVGTVQIDGSSVEHAMSAQEDIGK